MHSSPGLAKLAILSLVAVLVWPPVTPAQQKPPAGTQSAQAKPPQKPATTSTQAKRSRSRYFVPTYADSAKDDIPEFDDQAVRAAALEALGRRNGSVVVVEPASGRILSIVNQRLAFAAGFQPCSTIKPVVAVAALTEGIINRETMVKVAPRTYMNLTEAMARSNNPYFEELGRRMGFETVSRYSRLLGLGEPAGYNIFEEHPGRFPAEPPANGGVGRMSSFGEGIHITPLQLASLAITLANGGTVYYLQYPRTEEERAGFTPRIKRKLEIEALLPELRDGMLATVLYGTARSSFDPEGDQLLGKTGTCSADGSRLGWFVSYSSRTEPRMVVVVLLRGSSQVVNGSTAADIASGVYRRLRERNYFGDAKPQDAFTLGSPPVDGPR